MASSRLVELGWSDTLAAQFAPYAGQDLVPARVAVEHRKSYELLTEHGDVRAAIAGRLRHHVKKRRDLPAVGDWVAFHRGADDGLGLIDAVLPRRSVFVRKAAGTTVAEQIVAANVDVVFLVTSLNAELNLRRLERYLTLAWESGATPVVVLSKADLCEDPVARRAEVATVAVGVEVFTTSRADVASVLALETMLRPNRTGALLGSSGVGKSTLINLLLNDERLATGAIREADDRGRHTTTRRELIVLPGGGIVIDTPGMREIQVADAGEGLQAAFDDIDALAAACAFGNCTHQSEPDCAVKAAVQSRTLDAGRLAGYHKLQREIGHRAAWEDKRAASVAKSKVKAADRALQKRLKDKRR